MNIKGRLEKLEKSKPKIDSLTGAELHERSAVLLKRWDELAKQGCPNCIDCKTPDDCIKLSMIAHKLRTLCVRLPT